MTLKYFNVKNGLSTGNIYLHAGNSNVVASTFIGNISVTNSANLGNAAVANFFIGDGGLLSNISVNSSNIANLANLANSANIANLANLANSANLAELANIANIVSSSAQPNITSVGSLVTLHVLGDTTLDGNLTVNGTVTSVNSTIVEIDDLAIVLANDASSSSQANGAGIIINGANATMLYNSTSNSFVFNHQISADGGLLSNVQGANVSGAVSYATTANSVAGANVSGQVANATVAGTVYTNAQPNITSVGTLTSANISGNLTSGNANLGNLVTANYVNGGNLKATGNIESSNTTSGSLQVVGGAGITGNVFIGGILTVTGDFQVGNLNSNGNIINNGFVTFTQPITVTASNAATSTTTGAIVTGGGIGAAGNIFAGGDLNIAGTANIGNLNANVLNVASITTGTGSGGNISGANWVFANYFSGAGNNLSNIQGANITGAVAYATVANSVAVANVSGLGNLATLNRDGNAGNILYGNGVFAAAPSGSGTYGNSNVATFLASFGSNTITTTGNITSGNANLGNAVTANYFVGNGSLLTGIAKASSADSVANGNSNVNIVTANGNVTIAAVGNTVATFTGTGVNVAGYVNATGNIIAANATLGNSVTANYFIGSGANLTSLTGANVTGTVANATYAISTGSANTAATVTGNAQPNITSVGTLTNLDISGNIVVGGNLTVNGTLTSINSTIVQIDDLAIVLANDASTSSQANGAGIIINGASANVLYINSTNSFTFSHKISADGSLLSNLTVGNITGLGNIATINKDGNASNILYGNGVFASLPAAYTNANVATFLASFGSNTLTTTGNITAGNANLGNSVSANYFVGNGYYLTGVDQLSVGNALQADIANSIQVGNSTIKIPVANGNIVVGVNGTNIANVTTTGIDVTGNITATNANLGNAVTANYFIGSGNNLSNIRAANISGIVANANVANTAYAVAGANVSGQVGNALVAGTVYTNAQPNITSVGTLTDFTSNGNVNFTNASNVSLGAIANIHISGGTANYVLKTDGAGNLSWTAMTGGGGGGTATGLNADLPNVIISGGTSGQVLKTDGTGNLSWGTASGSESTVTAVDNFTGDGTTTTFTLSVTPQNINQTFINYNGALQLRAAYSLSGSDIVFSEAPANGSLIEVTTTMGVTQTGGSSLTVRNYVSDGVQLTYTVSSGMTASSMLVTENGLVQVPITDYTVSGSTLTFVTAPGYGVKIQIRELGTAVATITPAGSNTQVLFNDGGSFGNSSGFTYNKTSSTLTVSNIISGNILPSANVTYDLGSSTSAWKDLYLSGSTIHLAGAQLKTDTSGAMLLIPAPTVATPNPTALLLTATGGVTTVTSTGGNVSSGDLSNAIANTTSTGVSTKKSFFLNQQGNLTIYTGTARWYAPGNISISDVTARLINAADANVGVTIKKHLGSNGNITTSNITIGSGNVKVKGNLAITMVEDDYLTVDVTSIGTSNVGSDLNLVFTYTDA